MYVNLGSAGRVLWLHSNCSIDVGDSGLGWSGLEAGQWKCVCVCV